jgi:D-lyxose ketol-isomerase
MKKTISLFSLVLILLSTSCSNKTDKKAIVETKVEQKSELKFTNEQFYDAEGNFLEEKAKDALIEMLAYHNYPIFDGLREKIWLTDYNKGDYANLGLASVMFVNNEKDQYMLMDIFLLPGQMLGEHMHFAADGNPAKMEGWLVRHGKSYIAGVGENNRDQFPQVIIPKTHWDGKVTANRIVEANEGDFDSLAIVESAHWQMAGPEGAVITEVGNVHTNSGVLRSDPDMN